MKKICKVCNDDFTSPKYKLYCSSKCAKYGAEGVFYPDPNKKYKHPIPKNQEPAWGRR